ncbi:multi-sensor hybrid histidine kinase [Olavius sp. associated proteobacterium Delta 1]|nr:multi-sensor hybrid histidine kinase [Olavius sp. associated proteobacterium Delta 1]
MKTKYGITETLLYSMVILATVSVALVGSFWIMNEYDRFKKEEVTLREEYVDTQKNLIQQETDKVIDYVKYKKSQAETRLKQIIMNRTNEAYDIAINLYNQHRATKNPAELKKIIKDALRPIRYNNQRGYYFITRLDGVEILFADRPEMEGKNLIDMQDTQGKFVIRDMIAIIKESGKGYYRYAWTKPNNTGKDFPKIAFIKHFKPFDWLIGTGEYLDDVVSDIQQEVLARIENITFGEEGYIFAVQWNGLSLVDPQKGKNVIDITDANGVKIVQELIKASKSGGGYVSYVMPKFDRDTTYNKLSYTKDISDWEWLVGAGVNMDRIETVIDQKRVLLRQSVKNDIFKIILILFAILLFVLLIVKLVANRNKKNFNLFTAFFSKAATESVTIESENLHFKEFETLAEAANRMVNERNEAETALRKSERNYRQLVQSANSIILRMDTAGRVIFFNQYAQDFFGYSEADILGKNVIGTIVPQIDRAGFDLRQMIEDIGTHPERYASNENENIRRNGERVRVTWMNKAIYDDESRVSEILCVGIDVTQKWQLEKRLAQAQKMEAIGTLAGGIAHDFNNILSAIMGYTELSLIDIPQDSAVRKNLKQVLKAGGRAKELVQQILTYSRQREREMQPVKINLVVNEALKLLRASLPSTIQINNDIKSNLAVMSDPTNIHQVVMNLCTNAGHAMQENGGLLAVGLMDVDIDADFAKRHLGLNPGKYVRLTVSDTGHGMSPEVIERIFDPFFSTKNKGEGTGMGLSVVHGIVKSHGGTLTVDSTPGQGSVFKAFFPAIESEWVPDSEHADLMVTGTESILFVDDEAFQADIAKQMLSRLGYRLTTRTSSVEALELFMQSPEKFDLVISDMTMPHMTGDVLARELISIRPDIPIIVCTGYSDRINTDIASDIGIRELVMKPVVIKDIAQCIRRVLDADIDQSDPSYKRG